MMSDSQLVIRKTIYWEQSEEPFLRCGHGLYEQNLPISLKNLGLCSAPGAGIHESQSRFYENIVGRSLPFFQWLTPIIHEIRRNGRHFSTEELYLAANPVRPSPIQIEADETTYNFPIIIRFQVNKLFSMEISPFRMPQKPGIMPTKNSPDSPKNNVEDLQDIHWSLGYFGYFPSYTLEISIHQATKITLSRFFRTCGANWYGRNLIFSSG